MVQAVPAKILEGIVAAVPIGRLAKPDEIARGILFLASDELGLSPTQPKLEAQLRRSPKYSFRRRGTRAGETAHSRIGPVFRRAVIDAYQCLIMPAG
jgi:hypothetical protein